MNFEFLTDKRIQGPHQLITIKLCISHKDMADSRLLQNMEEIGLGHIQPGRLNPMN